MDYQSLYLKTVTELRKMAKEMAIRIPAGANKAIIINLLLEAFQHNTKDGKSAPQVSAAPEKNNEEPSDKAMEAACETAPVKAAQADPEGVQPDKAPEADTDAQPKTPSRMRMASNPQVIDRRMPARNYGEKGNAVPERVPVGPKVRTENAPRQEAPAARCEKRAENIPGRYPARQEGFQNRVGQRYESQNYQMRNAGRADGYEGRTRMDAETPNRYENRADQAADARMRGYRPDNGEGRMPPWQEVRERNTLRRDAGYDEGFDSGIPRNSGYYRNNDYIPRDYTNRDYTGRDGAYPSNDDRDYMARNAQNGADYAANNYRNRREGYYNEEYKTSNPAVPEMLESGECTEGSGILEIQNDGYGFLRAENYQQGAKDVYISIAQIRRFNLRMGDYVVGQTRPQREGDRYTAMMYITEVNGQSPEKMIGRKRFDELTPVYPCERLRLEQPGENDLSLRIIDMLAPIGKGQRGLIVSQPKAGKTTLLKKLANAITTAHPEIHLIVLLIDERPEEVTDMKRSINGEVVYSTFDETPESHAQVSEMVLERAQRLVEMGKDVVILMDSITRLARAYNLVIPPTGRSLSGGLDPGALHKPKRFFGAARNIENGGSLTIIATALVDTGSRMDDIIYEEFKGTGNMELHLDRKLSDRRIFPAVDMVRSGTRREELLLSEAELEGAYKVRRMLPNGNEQGDTEKIIGLMEKTDSNADFFQRLSAYKSVYGKNGFSMSKDNSNGRQ